MLIKKTKTGIISAELWCDERLKGQRVDVVRHFQSRRTSPNGVSQEFYTLVLPLAGDEASIFSCIDKDTRYEIRRAEKADGLKFCSVEATTDCVREFCDFYAQFASEKGLRPASRENLQRLSEAGMLTFTLAEKDGYPLVWHAYVMTPRRARLLHSASQFRSMGGSMKNAIGRANRWLHWEDIKKFKRLGQIEYDFGGWYEGTEDGEKVRINKFKESFGATMELNYNVVYATSWKGWIYLLTLRWLRGR